MKNKHEKPQKNLIFYRSPGGQLSPDYPFAKHRDTTLQFKDPTQFIQGLLPEHSKDQFHFYSWEQLYADHVTNETGMNDLAEYMHHKSANIAKAFAID